MDIRVLRYFLTVASEGNITKAAESLHITQPTLSRQLMDLEEELGTQLFVRGKRHIELTDGGIMFQQRVREIISLLEKAEREISGENQVVGGTVSVGCVESSAAFLLPEVMSAFSAKYPEVRYEFYAADGDDIRDKLDSGSLDIGILVEPVETSKYDFSRLAIKDRWGIILRDDDPLAARESVGMSEISHLPLILSRRTIVKEEIYEWLGAGNRLNVAATVNLPTNGLLLVEKKLGYMVSIEGAFAIRPKAGIRFIPFTPDRTSGHVVALRKNRIFNTAARLFVEELRKCDEEYTDAGKDGI